MRPFVNLGDGRDESVFWTWSAVKYALQRAGGVVDRERVDVGQWAHWLVEEEPELLSITYPLPSRYAYTVSADLCCRW